MGSRRQEIGKSTEEEMNHMTLTAELDRAPLYKADGRIQFWVIDHLRLKDIRLFCISHGAEAERIRDMDLQPGSWVLLTGTLEGSKVESASYILIVHKLDPIEIAAVPEIQNSLNGEKQ
jgi:hypothetical protein